MRITRTPEAENLKGRVASFAALFFCLGFFTVTWDKILIWKVAGFNLRICQPIFLISLVLTAISAPKTYWLSAIRSGFLICLFSINIFYLLGSPFSYFPLKSAMYSILLSFNIISIAVNGIVLVKLGKGRNLQGGALATLIFNSLLILIDQVGFQLGYVNGFIGFNQNEIVKWGVSRPHAFSYEPSYIASFLCLGLLIFAPLAFKKLHSHSALVITTAITITYAMIATTSRTAWFGLGIGLFTMLTADYFRYRKFNLKMATYLIGVVAAATVIFIATTPATQRQAMDKNLVSSVANLSDGSGNHRLRVFKYAYKMAVDTNFVGTGLGASYKYWAENGNTYESTIGGGFTPQSYGYEVVMSVWGQLLAEGGAIALLLYLASAMILIKALWTAWIKNGSPFALGCLASAVTWFIFTAFWLGNIARADIWVWISFWLIALIIENKSLEHEEATQGLDRKLRKNTRT